MTGISEVQIERMLCMQKITITDLIAENKEAIKPLLLTAADLLVF